MIFFFKQKTAYEIKECDWSSDVCSSDLTHKPKIGSRKLPKKPLYCLVVGDTRPESPANNIFYLVLSKIEGSRDRDGSIPLKHPGI